MTLIEGKGILYAWFEILGNKIRTECELKRKARNRCAKEVVIKSDLKVFEVVWIS